MVSASVSVALCTYNGAQYLNELFSSLLLQTVLPSELIICDDLSCDSTAELAYSSAQNYPFEVRIVVNNTTLGVTANFSKALTLCTGDYVALCDQDDIWLPERLAVSLRLMRQAELSAGSETPILVHSDLRVIDAEGNVMAPSFIKLRRLQPVQDEPLNKLLMQNTVTGSTILMNRALKKIALPIPDQVVMHDWWLALMAAARGRIIFEPQPTVLYRRHQQNVMGLNPYYSAKNLGRLAGEGGLDKSIAAMLRQAQALQERLKALNGGKSDQCLEQFLEAVDKSGPQAALAALRCGIGKTGLVRNTAFLLALMSGGYRKYL